MMSPMLSGPKLPSEFQKKTKNNPMRMSRILVSPKALVFISSFVWLSEFPGPYLYVELKRQALRMNKYRSHVKKQSLFIPLKSVLETVLLKSPIS